MQIFYAPRQADHSPQTFLVRGEPTPSPERSERADRLLGALHGAGYPVAEHNGRGSPELIQRLARIHTPRYLRFLETIYGRWQSLPQASAVVTPNVHPAAGARHYPSHPVGQAGWHLHDMACPIAEQSYPGILASAASAELAAEYVRDGHGDAYALCRPPGHHAGPETAGGFCFINNSALAASILREGYSRVAVLDVDLHHGNGTQSIFYERADVWTGSIHADTDAFYPFFWGGAAELGEGTGFGFNINFPLPLGSSGPVFLAGLEALLESLKDFDPEAVVVALGLDAHKDDPLAGLALETDDFSTIGQRIAELPQLCVLVQEGGYPTNALGDNLVAFLNGFTRCRSTI